jgi:hypothetical protein
MGEARAHEQGPIVCLANGNLNGRVPRLVADDLQRAYGRAVQVISLGHLTPLNAWPEERSRPHVVPVERIGRDEAERRVRAASAFVLPPFWHPYSRRLVGVARQAGTPVVCVVADVGYGARKLDATDPATLPDRICVADPVTRGLLIRNGIPHALIRNVGSPQLDSLLPAEPPPPPLPQPPWRVGLLANPDGKRERLTDRNAVTDEGVLLAIHRALRGRHDVRLTVRTHPRQDPARIAEAFPLPEGARIDPLEPRSTLPEFIASQHLVVGSYSMGLMIARLLGRPAVSFQPPRDDDGLRREIFAAWDVPVATEEAELAVRIAGGLQSAGAPIAGRSLLYEPGGSLRAIARVIDEARSSCGRNAGSDRAPRMERAS